MNAELTGEDVRLCRRRCVVPTVVITPLSPGRVALAAPIGVQELVLAVWLIVKGFHRSVLMPRP